MKVTEHTLFDYLRDIVVNSIPDSKYIRVLLPEGEYKDVRSAIEGVPPVGDGGLIDDGRTMVIFRGVRIEFVCDYLTDDEELTYVLLENEMLRRENEVLGIKLKNREMSVEFWEKGFNGCVSELSVMNDKLDKIPTFIRKIFGAI